MSTFLHTLIFVKTSTYSNPLSINGKNCIIVSNGISKFIVSDHGIFLNECAVNEDYIRFSIQVAPNPATNYTIVKFKNKLQKNYAYNICLKYITSNTERNN